LYTRLITANQWRFSQTGQEWGEGQIMSVRLRLIIGLPLFGLMFFYLGLRISSRITLQEYSLRGWSAELRDGRAVIANVSANSPATGVLQKGDVVVAFWSERPDATPLVMPDRWRVPPGVRYKLTVSRNGQLQELPLQTTRVPFGGPSSGVIYFFYMLTLLLFLVTGVTVFILKPGDEQAWLLALMLTTPVALLTLNLEYIPLPRWIYLAALLTQSLATVFFPAILRFFLIFPERSPLLRRFPKLEWLIYLPYLLLLAPREIVGDVLTAFNMAPAWRESFLRSTSNFILGLCAAYLLAGLIAMAVNYRAAGDRSRRKLRVVMVGSGAGFLNVFLMQFGYFVGLAYAFPTLWRWFDNCLLFTLPLIPLSFAYAIARHQVIPISLIIRRGARYVLVSRGSIVLGIVIVGLTGAALLSTIFSRLQPPPIVNGMVSAVVGVIAYNIFRSLHRRYLAPMIDRRFFRQAYDTRQIIADLTESLRTTTDLDHLLEMVATKIQAALQTANVTIFLRDEATGDYRNAYSCDYVEEDGRALNRERQSLLPYHVEIVKRLSDNGKPLDVEQYISAAQQASDNEISLADRQEGHNAGHIVPINHVGPLNTIDPELAALIEIKSVLLLPLSSKGEMLGVVSLGARLGDLPYSREDEQLLMSVAGPATLAIENARLVERMIAEAGLRQELEAENEIRAKELEGARQLQFSMLPQALPQLPHLEIAAYMKPATEVGGDYYDFHLSDDGVLTVAVGDATGHGLKAGTVVTATKSLFNHLAQESEIPAIFQQSSRALKRMNLRSLFMAMAIAKVKGYQLRLGSAGMPPTLIYRAARRVVEEISLRGVPLGSLMDYSYRERSLGLAPGDVVVLMSDGYPERFNSKNEMLDYGSAKSVLLEIAILPPQEIIEVFVKIADKWAEGRPQDDDMTFVVMKVK
jgi:serine phosphatase RsbU (regulator of sigma subunit)